MSGAIGLSEDGAVREEGEGVESEGGEVESEEEEEGAVRGAEHPNLSPEEYAKRRKWEK